MNLRVGAGDSRPARGVGPARSAANLLLGRPTATVLAFALPVLAVKLIIAARTYGSKDITHWADFAAGVRSAGPVGIYGLTFPLSFYNHPPLMGFVLWFVNGLRDVGIPLGFTIRALASLADVGSALVVLELLRRRTDVRTATAAAILVALSPVLFLVSGFHGNTDPIFVFLTVLSLYLLLDRRAPAVAGAMLALAIGVKIVPVVVLPALLVYAWKLGGRTAALFAIGFAGVSALTWGPALLAQFHSVVAHVLGYHGNGYSLWGVMQLGHWLHDPAWVGLLSGPGSVVLVCVSALVPAAAIWRRPAVVLPAVAWSLLVFLALATSFGVQYLVWAVVAGYFVNFWLATVYNLSAGAVLAEIYDRWSGGLPWNYADPSVFTTA